MTMISDVFLGPVCDYVIAPVSRYSGVWKMPVLTAGAQAENFDNREEYPTLTRMMGSYKLVGEALRHILHVFGWNVAGLLYYNHGVNSLMGHSRCHFTLSAVYTALGQKPEYRSFNDTADQNVFKDLLTVLSHSARSESSSSVSAHIYGNFALTTTRMSKTKFGFFFLELFFNLFVNAHVLISFLTDLI